MTPEVSFATTSSVSSAPEKPVSPCVAKNCAQWLPTFLTAAMRPCLPSRLAAVPDRRRFALDRPGNGLAPPGSVHRALVGEHNTRCEIPDLQGSDDVCVLDRVFPPPGYRPCSPRGICWVMGCDIDGDW